MLFRFFRGHTLRRRLRPSTVAISRRAEPLESRHLLTVGLANGSAAMLSPSPIANVTNTVPTGLTPNEVRSAYGFDRVSFGSSHVAGDGSGQTIAIVNPYSDPNLASDLESFNQTFGLPNANLVQVGQDGQPSSAPTNTSWSLETAMDVEWAHAIAPAAKILLVNANDDSLGSLTSAVDYARNQTGVDAVSMSWGVGEFSGETALDGLFTTPAGHQGVMFVAASGDGNTTAVWPAASPNVLSVGGTSLAINNGSYAGETNWSGSGGGPSAFEPAPTSQSGVSGGGVRTTPDVSYDANPSTGFAVYSTVPYGGENGWFEMGGTSAGAPQWAALVAIADQGRAANGVGSLSNMSAVIGALSSSDFNSVTTATAGSEQSASAAGRGSPVANAIINNLIAITVPATSNIPATGAHVGGTTTTSPTVPPGSPTKHATPLDVVVLVAIPPQIQSVGQISFAVPALAVSSASAAVAAAPSIASSRSIDLDIVSLGSSQVADEESQEATKDQDEEESEPSSPEESSRKGGNGSSVAGTVMARRAGTSSSELHDLCFADLSWSAVPELGELPLFGLGEMGDVFPSPLLMVAALLTSFEGYRRFRTDSDDKKTEEL
jgi:hypothetical protein